VGCAKTVPCRLVRVLPCASRCRLDRPRHPCLGWHERCNCDVWRSSCSSSSELPVPSHGTIVPVAGSRIQWIAAHNAQSVYVELNQEPTVRGAVDERVWPDLTIVWEGWWVLPEDGSVAVQASVTDVKVASTAISSSPFPRKIMACASCRTRGKRGAPMAFSVYQRRIATSARWSFNFFRDTPKTRTVRLGESRPQR
jgi:hypothetical protein